MKFGTPRKRFLPPFRRMKRRGGGGAGWWLDEETRGWLVRSSKGHATLTNELHNCVPVQPVIDAYVTELLRRERSAVVDGMMDSLRAMLVQIATAVLEAFE